MSVLLAMRTPARSLAAALVLGLTMTGALVVAAASPAAAAAATTTTLSSSANPSTPGQAVILTATVVGTTPSGAVDFVESGVLLGSAVVTDGVATLSVASFAPGAHQLVATYSGDAGNDPSVATLTQTVTAPVVSPKVRLAASAAKVSVGDRIRLRWRTKNADAVTATGDWSGEQRRRGTARLRVTERGKNVFKLTVQNASGVETARVVVMAARKSKALELEVTKELVLTGSQVAVAADGLAPRETFTLRLNGASLATGRADKHGDVTRRIEVPDGAAEGSLPLTLTGSNPGRVGEAVLGVITPIKALSLEVADRKVRAKGTQSLTVTGLAPTETVSVVYRGNRIAVGRADASGSFTCVFEVGNKVGPRTVRVVGKVAGRTGEATFEITRAPGASSVPVTTG